MKKDSNVSLDKMHKIFLGRPDGLLLKLRFSCTECDNDGEARRAAGGQLRGGHRATRAATHRRQIPGETVRKASATLSGTGIFLLATLKCFPRFM